MRALVGIVVLLALLVTLVVVAGEVVGRPAAEGAIADHIAQRYQLTRKPSVTISGFPLVVRAAQGRVDAVDVVLDGYETQGVRVKRFALHLQEVTFDLLAVVRGNDQARAEKGTAQALLTDADVTSYLRAHRVPVVVGFQPGQAVVSGRVELAGFGADVSATGRISLSDGALRFTPEAAKAGPVSVGPELLGAVRAALSFTVPIPAIAGVQVTSLALRDGEAVLGADVTRYILSKLKEGALAPGGHGGLDAEPGPPFAATMHIPRDHRCEERLSASRVAT